jgi:hypothetical protein
MQRSPKVAQKGPLYFGASSMDDTKAKNGKTVEKLCLDFASFTICFGNDNHF